MKIDKNQTDNIVSIRNRRRLCRAETEMFLVKNSTALIYQQWGFQKSFIWKFSYRKNDFLFLFFTRR